MTFTHALATNNYGPAKFIVTSSAANGTHTTIASAMAAASSGDTIFIRPGTYTENITMTSGVNLTAYACDGLSPSVIIKGNVTFGSGVSGCLSSICLETNGAACLTVSGANACFVAIVGCYIRCTDATAISYTNSNANSQINVINSNGVVSSSNIFFAMTATGLLSFDRFFLNNASGVGTACTASAGTLNFVNCYFEMPISLTGSVTSNNYQTTFATLNSNSTAITANTSNSPVYLDCVFASGSASAVTVTQGATLNNCTVSSSNANPVTGAGTLTYNQIGLSSTTGTINTTTLTGTVNYTGISRSPKQPAFLATNTTSPTNVTGDGTVYTVVFDSEIFDQGANFASNTFTAPVTGRYLLSANVLMSGLTTAMTVGAVRFVTSNRTYSVSIDAAKVFDGNTNATYPITSIVDMDVSDTVTVAVVLSNGTKVADVIGHATDALTSFSGILLA